MNHSFLSFFHSHACAALVGMVLLLGVSTAAYADDMKDSKYYTMSAYSDHVHFEVLLTDLYRGNTWADEGCIRAVNVSRTRDINLIQVYTRDMDSDYNENWIVYANNELQGSIAFLTNAIGGEKKLSFSTEQLWVWKGSNNDRTYAKFDFYFPPEMVGDTWYFYYTYKHNKGNTYHMFLGDLTCINRVGMYEFDATKFTYERTDACKIEVKLPAMPDDVPAKLKDNRYRVGKYELTLTYHFYDGTEKIQKETLSCDTKEKTCTLEIPTEWTNFQSLDLETYMLNALYCKDSGSYFWRRESRIISRNIFAVVPQPENLHADYLQFEHKVDLAWLNFHDYGNGYRFDGASKPYVYRMETGRNGEILSGEKWTQVIIRPNIGTTKKNTYADNSVEPNKYYKYLILNVPNSWAGTGNINDRELESPSERTIAMLGHVESEVIGTAPTMDIYDLAQDMEVTDKVKLTWKYSRVPVRAKTVNFKLMRRQKGTDAWSDLGEVQADANPASGAIASFIDDFVGSSRVRYDYKVQLSINDDQNVFESDVVTAGVIDGSTVKTLDASKGVYDNAVRVVWNVKQVGRDNTNFELYRRYANSGAEFMKIYATSGTNDSYSFDDNTVQPGYYYEYKIEAYAGDKASYNGSSYQNALSTVGFCQSTGSIAGKVSFGSSGNAVSDVRLTLRGEDGDEGNLQAYSQRVNGASTGIAWAADSTTTASLFGNGKDYTVQFFLRPDDNLGTGSLIGEIPNLGRLRLGEKDDDGYRLLLERLDGKKESIRNTFSKYNKFVFTFFDDNNNGNNYYSEELGGIVYGNQSSLDSALQVVRNLPGYLVGTDEVKRDDIYNITNFTTQSIRGYLDMIEVPLEKEVFIDKLSWQGVVYDTGLKVRPSVFSLVSVDNDNGEPTLSVNGEKSSQFTQVSTKEYVAEEGNRDEVCPDFIIRDNESLNEIVNCKYEILEKLYAISGKRDLYFHAKGNAKVSSTIAYQNSFSVGGTDGLGDDEAFSGNLTEVRVWNHVLTEKEHASTDDRIMSGSEAGLKIYWPMSEGLARMVFDASSTNDASNGNHAIVGNNIMPSRIVPSIDQLSRYAVTNANGEYVIRGIPYIGSGSGYTLTPSLSIHKFSPISRNGFVSAGSLVLNNYDFTDQSSFTVRGKVTFKDTDIPADSIMFKIDGAIAQKDNKPVMTDANGNYELSMPIGSHTISPYKEGHVFSQFPEDGTVHAFYNDETINFFDQTLVNVTGRVNGGFADKDEPLGFRRSVNRVGQATIKLSLGKETNCSFNYVVDKDGNGECGKDPIVVESATDAIQSTAYRAGGSYYDTFYINIKTDPKTGEFSALLPPLEYVVNSITFDGGHDYDNEPLFKDNLPVLNATNCIVANMPFDSLIVDKDNVQFYQYSAKMIRQLRTTPTISVTQNGMENGAFGERVLSVRDDASQDAVDVPVLQLTDSGYKYLYGHPIFVQGNSYVFTINVSEQYTNQDTKEVAKECPEDAVVNISNEASTTAATIVAIDMTVDQQEVHPGDVADVDNILVAPNSEGKVEYGWIAGLPCLSGEYLRHLTIGVTIGGRTTVWKAPDSQTDALDLVVSGGIMTGTNFVTGGPDQVDMVLRRPPGSTSYAQWSNDSVYVKTKTTTVTSSRSRGGGADIFISPTIEVDLGAGIFKVTKYRLVFNDVTVRRNNVYDDIEVEKEQNSYSVSTSVKTPSGSMYVQNDGDTYIGRASNLTFGEGRYVGLIKQSDGTYKLGDKSSICTGLSFLTTFVLPQQYVEQTLIPNWQKIINDKLIYVPEYSDTYCKKEPGKVLYYTRLKPGDYGYGTANCDLNVWTEKQYKDANGHPSYLRVDGITHSSGDVVTDSVEWANQQITAWQNTIYRNEKDKIEAFDDVGKYLIDNFSIAGGTSVNQTTKETIVNNMDLEHSKVSWNVSNNSRIGATFNDAGAIGVLTFNNGKTTETVTSQGITQAHGTSWQLSDASPATALSVDVYNSPQGWGPIFRTRGGQTCNPYEGATVTKYYRKGTELDKATMRVENPKLSVVGAAELSDVPTGTKGEFKLQLSNESETGNPCTYVLEVLDNSNPNGAILTMDGQKISKGNQGRTIRLGGSESIVKSLFVEQGDRSVIEYPGIKLVLRSENDITTLSDPVELKVSFIPSSASIDIAVDHTVLNSELKEKNKGVIVTLSNLDRQYEGLKGVRIQNRRKGLDTWSLSKEWVVKPANATEEKIPDGTTITCPISFPDDGVYELRAQTFGSYGPSEEVTYATNIIEVTQDIRGPQILGMPYPEFGILTYNTRNDMNVRFNEPINTNALSKTGNFRIVGNLNNSISENKVPDVAVLLNRDEIATQASYPVGDGDIAFECWLYRQDDGTLFGIGTEDNMLALSTRDNGKAVLRFGDENQTLTTDVTLPANIWNYIAMSYSHGRDGEKATVSALYVNDNTKDPVYIVKDHAIDKMTGRGKLHVGGDSLVGRIRDVALWNASKNLTEMYQEREVVKANYTPGLIGYWRMDEGHGTTLVDRVRSANIVMRSESWYINNMNRAYQADGSNWLKVDISTFAPRQSDNFAVEMWFRADQDNNAEFSELMDLGNEINIALLDGKLNLQTKVHGEEGVMSSNMELSDVDYNDSQWHHFALNVRRGGNAIAYIDGMPLKTIPETQIPAPMKENMIFGTNFHGDIDEIRIWNAALTGELIADRRYERLDSTYTGLIGYFPMERIHREQSGTITSDFSLDNFGDKSVCSLSMDVREGEIFRQATSAPALLPGAQRLRLDEQDFSFVASESEIFFQFPDNMAPFMDGNEFNVTVSNVKDVHGNISEPVEWKFTADFALLEWLNFDDDELVFDRMNPMTFTKMLVNSTSSVQTYEILNLPTWISVDHPIGTIGPSIEDITFHVHPSAPIGTHVIDVYVSDCHGIKRSFRTKITVVGDEPEWTCNPSLFEGSMILVGQLYVSDRICENPLSKIAAFDEAGVCHGIAHPEYMATRDAYYLNMMVYGNSDDKSDRFTFKMYDASTGITYPLMHVTREDGIVVDTIAFVSNAIFGSYDNPLLFDAADDIMQTVELPRGWTWMSVYLKPRSTAIADVLPKEKSVATGILNIKSQNAFSTVDGNGKVQGEVADIVPGKMYKVQVSKTTEFDIFGLPINVDDTMQTIHHGFNWMGTLSTEVMSPEEAFADLKPERNDMVKNRSQVALYKGNGVWEGTLQSIVPGEGYIYESKADGDKSFHYPKLGTQTALRAASRHNAPTRHLAPAEHFTPADPYQFPDNMNVVAVVVKDGVRVPNAEIGAFIDGECRGAIRANVGSDYYFLTVMGTSATDQGKVLEIRVYYNGDEYLAANHIAFVNDVVAGTLDEPCLIDLDEATGVTSVYNADNDDDGWYTLQGFKLQQRPRMRGVYIHKGVKVVVE